MESGTTFDLRIDSTIPEVIISLTFWSAGNWWEIEITKWQVGSGMAADQQRALTSAKSVAQSVANGLKCEFNSKLFDGR